MTLNIGNCSRCGRLYAKNNIHDVCASCVKEIDKQYEIVAKYLRENRGCTIGELSEATEVPVRQIVKFIREGRISIASMPNMSYPCESCGAEIREGHLCENCRKKLSKEVSNLAEDQKRKESMKHQENHASYNIKDRLQKDRY